MAEKLSKKELLERIDQAAREGATKFILESEGLTSVPAQIGELINLRDLRLSNNKLTEVPAEIGQLTNLTTLGLMYNDLTSLPAEIGQLTNLTTLGLMYNDLTSLPAEIGELTNLTTLSIASNKLTTLPSEIGELTKLDTLDLMLNNLTTLPAEIGELTNLTMLDLVYNNLTSLSAEITRLTNLTMLNIGNNNLTSLPAEIARLTNLTKLYLMHNQLTTLPCEIGELTKLDTLDLSANNLTTLPAEILDLLGLEIRWHWDTEKNGIFLGGNPLEVPPMEVVKRGTEAVRNYFRQLEEEGKDWLYEAKLLIVGEGGAGKTTLAKKIEDEDYNLQDGEESTEGIDVIEWHFKMGDGQDFRVNIWDFGGQEIYHATHQFFLTKRSLYALVADTRKEDTDFYYWLNVVELLSDGSPVLIFKNEKQDRHREINESALRGQFANMKEVTAGNLANNGGLGEMKERIRRYISKLPHIGSELPKTWVKVREALEKDKRNYISLEEYLNICGENGFTSEKDKLQLSGYLHDLGVCLHFQDNPLLKKIVILRPEWGTDAVYMVLDNDDVIRNRGRFTAADLDKIWFDDKYAGMRDELLELMMNFKLCYKIKNKGEYISPQLLTMNQPAYEWDDQENLVLRYTYEFMPKGIVTRFIVEMHGYIANQDGMWREGIVLEKDETRAEVIENYGKREIKIRVAGKHRKELITIVLYELDKIHDSYKNLKYSKWIPCNCEDCKGSQKPHSYRFDTLRGFLVDRQYEIQCQRRSYRMVNVLGLIDDVVDIQKTKGLEKGLLKGDIIEAMEKGGLHLNIDARSRLTAIQKQNVSQEQKTGDKEGEKKWYKTLPGLLGVIVAFLTIVSLSIVIGIQIYKFFGGRTEEKPKTKQVESEKRVRVETDE